MTLIELGYAGAEPETPPPSPIDRRSARRLLAALVAVLCLVTLTASTRPRQHALVQLWSVPDVQEGDFTVIGDTVVVVSGADGETMTGYALADGTKRWSRTMPEQVPLLVADTDARVLLLPTGMRSAPLDAEADVYFFTETIALDVATGADLWRSAGAYTGTFSGWPAAGTVLLEDKTRDGMGTARLRLVRLADGGTIWSQETPGVQRWLTLGADPGRPDRVATVDGDGNVRVLRLADGTEAAHGTVEWRSVSPESGDFIDLVAEGDVLAVLQSNGNRSTVVAYSTRTLRRLWTAGQDGNSSFYGCGAVLCTDGGGELLGYDWATGKVRWRAPGQGYARAVGQDLLIAESDADTTRKTLLEAATGRRLADLGTGQPPWGYAGGTLVTIGVSPSQVGRAVVRWVDPGSGDTFPVGTMGPVNDRMFLLAGRLLLCTDTLRGGLTVTAVG